MGPSYGFHGTRATTPTRWTSSSGVATYRKNAIIVPVNWYDNPWFPKVLQEEKAQDYENDPEMAEHVWGGGYEIISAGAYFSKHIAAAEKQGRVGFFLLYPW